jgi:IS605 OrfB family transposase
VHARAADLREDGLHQLTTRLAARYGTIVIEDLHVAGMVRNRRLGRRISDAGFGALRRQLACKTAWHGGQLVTADRFYPSSKTCSACGTVKAKLSLSERTCTCGQCGLVTGRDLNAARNLGALAGGASSPSRGRRKTSPLETRARPAPRAPGTGYRHGKTTPPAGAASARTARHRLPDQREDNQNSLKGNGVSGQPCS